MNLILTAVLAWASLGIQKANGTEHVIKPKLTLLEQEEAKAKEIESWIFDEFAFVDPRLITVEIVEPVPDSDAKPQFRVRRALVWYITYRVANRGDKPRLFVPNFVFVDDKGKPYQDTVIPKAQAEIQRRENPLQPLENSVSIVRELQPSKEEGVDNWVHGVAMWEGIDPTADSFEILVEGLSNVVRVIDDPATGQKKTQRKTMQLKFGRPGDEFNQNSREVRFQGVEWIYR